MMVIDDLELKRLEIQEKLDGTKTQKQRNQQGQFATPYPLAKEMLKYAKSHFTPNSKICFLDPSFGTGVLYSAFLEVFSPGQIFDAVGYEIDPLYGKLAKKLWLPTPVRLNIADFTRATPPRLDSEKANLLISNPPYVRHHHLPKSEKKRLQDLTNKLAGIKLSQLASLYCYFMGIAHDWMAENCLAGWLIPSGFMDVNYGRQIREYLLTRVTLLRIHCYDFSELQFKDALVSSAVVWLKKTTPSKDIAVEFTNCGSLEKPKQSYLIPLEVLQNSDKWNYWTLGNSSSITINAGVSSLSYDTVKLSDLFTIKRGIATGANNFFILCHAQICYYQLPWKIFKPILPSCRNLEVDEIQGDPLGHPVLKHQLFVLDCQKTENEVKEQFPNLWKYLQMGIEQGVNQRYLCRHRQIWYSQENRPPSPFLCTYMGRKKTGNGKPFRFILNHSQATATNVYLMLYPKLALKQAIKEHPSLKQKVWRSLNQISDEMLMSQGRVYGGGLHKLEPKELGNIRVLNFIF